jgi:NAD(P)H-hydrate epimerase
MMTSPTTQQRLAELFQQAKQAHLQAFLETDGADPEWPLWYADYLHETLKEILQANLTKSELVYLLVQMDREQRESAPHAEWSEYYAEFCLLNIPQVSGREP